MGRTSHKNTKVLVDFQSVREGPVIGSYYNWSGNIIGIASQTDNATFVLNLPFNARLHRIALRNSGGATSWKIRRLTPSSATRVVVGDTQILNADIASGAAAAVTIVTPSSATNSILAAQRNMLQGDQIGIFYTNGATTPFLDIAMTFTVLGFALDTSNTNTQGRPDADD